MADALLDAAPTTRLMIASLAEPTPAPPKERRRYPQDARERGPTESFMADIANGIGSTTALGIGTSLRTRIDAAGDRDFVRVNLTAGQTYDFRLHGVGVDAARDVDLVLRNAAGVALAGNDDAGAAAWGGSSGTDSRLTFRATTSGTYFVDVGAAGAGDILLTAAVHNPAGMVFTDDEIAWQLTNNYWDHSLPGARFTAAFDIGADRTLTVDTDGLTAAGRTLANAALKMWGDVIGIRFVEAGATADIRFHDDDDGGGQPVAYGGPAASDGRIVYSEVNVSEGWLAEFGSAIASYSFETYLHEIGHALGLGHAGNYDGSATFGVDNYYRNDSLAHSIMSYIQVYGDEFDDPNPTVPATFRHMLTPALADIVAVQSLYGPLAPTRVGNTTYGFGANTGNGVLDRATLIGASMFMTVIDGGGVDTLNFARSAARQAIDLTPGADSSVLGGRMNLWIERGTLIENAYAGAGADALTGNAAANILAGNAGNDTMLGAGGNDTMAGAAGNDVLDGGLGNDGVSGGDGVDRLAGGFGNDLLWGGGADDVLDGGDGDDRLDGGDGLDRLAGGNGNDVLSGLAGNDALWSGFGNDLATGGLGNDVVQGAIGNDTLGGDAGNDTLAGGDGHDRIVGGDGADRIAGDGGDDVLSGGTGIDQLAGGFGNDRIWGDAEGDGLAGGAGNDLLAGGTGVDTLRGEDGNDTLAGDADNDALLGAAGNDNLVGGDGSDTLAGDLGADLLRGGTGEDRILTGADADIVAFAHGGGRDVVVDFANDQDRLDLAAFNFADAEAVLALARTLGTSLLIDFGAGDAVLLEHFSRNALDAKDLIL